MAKRRMISNEILESNSVYPLSNNAKLLYIYLIMAADDDGFVSSTIKALKELGLDQKHIEELIMANLVHVFESKVLVILDWTIHNKIAPTKRQETLHQFEYKYLDKTRNGRYFILSDEDLREIEENIDNEDGKPISKTDIDVQNIEFETRLLEQKKYKKIYVEE